MAVTRIILISLCAICMFQILNVSCYNQGIMGNFAERNCIRTYERECFRGYKSSPGGPRQQTEAYLVSLKLEDHCRIANNSAACLEGFLASPPEEETCYLLNSEQREKFRQLIRVGLEEVKAVCETGFTKFNTAYKCLLYRGTHLDRLIALTESCVDDIRIDGLTLSQNGDMCESIKGKLGCFKRSAATICGEEVSDTINELAQLYVRAHVILGMLPSC